jgi:hypothetical protein
MADERSFEERFAEPIAWCLIIGGAVAVVVGVAKLSAPLAWIVAGAAAVCVGWRLGR